MALEAPVVGLQCLRCGTRFSEPRLFAGCPRCRAEGVAVNLTVEYDLSALAGISSAELAGDGQGLWRYRRLLPGRAAHPVSLSESILREHHGLALGE